jgi:type IV secretion system protein VirB6/type IV secretion system protein TrbL
MKCSFKIIFLLVVLIAFVVLPAQTFASINGDGLLNDVTNRFLTQSATWGTTITMYATWLFWVLATISMVWTFGLMALRKADIGEFFAEFLRFTVTTGFFLWLLSNGPNMAMAVINSLRQIGATAGGVANTLTPSTPISIGFDIVKKVFAGLSWVHPIDNLAIVFISAALVVCMAVVAANVLIALVTAWTMAYAGTFILGFGGSRWTSDMAIGYFKAMLGIGLELMTMTLLIGIATSVIDGFYANLDASSIYELLLIFCVCVVLALLINKIPGRVAALVGGGSGTSIGAGTVMAAAAMGAAAAATAGATAMGGMAAMAGGGSAIKAAYEKAQSNLGGETGGSMPSFGGSGGYDGGGVSNLASAMGGDSNGTMPNFSGSSAGSDTRGNEQASKGSTSTIANLAQGGMDVAKASFNERVGGTTGGRIAAAIRASSPVVDTIISSTFNENSLSAGTSEPFNPESEVAAFRDRNSQSS